MTRLRRLRVPSILLLALVGALVFAAGASAAETKVGEGTSPANPSILGSADLLAASASYDPSSGVVTFTATTREAPAKPGEVSPEEEELSLIAAVAVPEVPGSCAYENQDPPATLISAPYNNEYGETIVFASESPPTFAGPATKSQNGAKTGLAAAVTGAVDGPYSCAFVAVSKDGPSEAIDVIAFPIAVPAPATTPSITAPAPSAPPAPAAFSIAKPKPAKAKEGKWTKVAVKVTNSGGTATGPIAIKAKAPKGVTLRPASGSLQLPALLPGQSWTVSFQVKVTSKAKGSSAIALTASSGAISAGGSLVLKRAG